MNSCLYETRIWHRRLIPKEHEFAYKFFSFYIDLDELDILVSDKGLVSRNRFNVYSFYDRDHVTRDCLNVKESLYAWLAERGVDMSGGRVMLLTYFRVFGYVFNPVSFYFCFDRDRRPVGVVPEVGNTFGELKLFLLGNKHLSGVQFDHSEEKMYYVSPFTRLDDRFDFRLQIPDESLNIQVDTSRSGQKVIETAMTGQRHLWSQRELLKMGLKFPFVTAKVITLIHWHAFRLWLKKIPYQEKTACPHLQKEVYRASRKH